MKKILVTGADGFIGSHLTEKLIRLGYDVRAFVFYNSFNSWGWLDDSPDEIKRNLDIFAGDIRDFNGVLSAMEGCDSVLHLAALISIPYSYHSPDAYVDTNIKGTLNILQAAKLKNLTKIIHTSTSEVYGSAQHIPISETHPLSAQSPYSATKIGADQLALSFHKSFGTPVTIIRPFNTFGPRQSSRAVIPTIITQLLSGKGTLKLGSINTTRDFNYVDDTVNGFIAALETNNSVGNVINLGNGIEISIEDTATLIAKIMNKDPKILLDEIRIRPNLSEVDRLCADNTLAKELLGWSPALDGIEGFKLGLQRTIAWFSVPDNLKKYKSNTYNI